MKLLALATERIECVVVGMAQSLQLQTLPLGLRRFHRQLTSVHNMSTYLGRNRWPPCNARLSSGTQGLAFVSGSNNASEVSSETPGRVLGCLLPSANEHRSRFRCHRRQSRTSHSSARRP